MKLMIQMLNLKLNRQKRRRQNKLQNRLLESRQSLKPVRRHVWRGTSRRKCIEEIKIKVKQNLSSINSIIFFRLSSPIQRDRSVGEQKHIAIKSFAWFYEVYHYKVYERNIGIKRWVLLRTAQTLLLCIFITIRHLLI